RSQPARSVPPGWTHTGRVNPGHEVQLTFALRQQGMGRLAQLVDAVSDPHSPRYGKYLSLEQVRDLVQPSPATLMVVLKWLQGHGVENCRSVTTLDFLECHMSARWRWNIHAAEGLHAPWMPRVATALQQMLREGVDECRPPALGFRAALSPDPLAELEPGAIHRDNPRHQVCCQSELTGELQTSCAVDLLSVGRAGAGGPSAPGASGAVEAWCPPRRHESQEPFLAWLLLLSNMSSLPWVHSVSYGDDEDSLSLAYMERVNVEFMKAAARGLTILFASGDDGAGCRRVPGGNHTFRPSFPASSPYVTTVGGTSFKNPFLVTAEVTDYISGGGFSNVFPMPDYQVR
ncbi:Tripeptidyl-peptidase 1, partial [Cathartes aura]